MRRSQHSIWCSISDAWRRPLAYSREDKLLRLGFGPDVARTPRGRLLPRCFPVCTTAG